MADGARSVNVKAPFFLTYSFPSTLLCGNVQLTNARLIKPNAFAFLASWMSMANASVMKSFMRLASFNVLPPCPCATVYASRRSTPLGVNSRRHLIDQIDAAKMAFCSTQRSDPGGHLWPGTGSLVSTGRPIIVASVPRSDPSEPWFQPGPLGPRFRP